MSYDYILHLMTDMLQYEIQVFEYVLHIDLIWFDLLRILFYGGGRLFMPGNEWHYVVCDRIEVTAFNF